MKPWYNSLWLPKRGWTEYFYQSVTVAVHFILRKIRPHYMWYSLLRPIMHMLLDSGAFDPMDPYWNYSFLAFLKKCLFTLKNKLHSCKFASAQALTQMHICKHSLLHTSGSVYLFLILWVRFHLEMLFLAACQVVIYQIDLSLGQWMLWACRGCLLCKLIILHPRQGWAVEWILASLCREVLHRLSSSSRFSVLFSHVSVGSYKGELGSEFSFSSPLMTFLFTLLNSWEGKTVEWCCLDTLHSRSQGVTKVMQFVPSLLVVICLS